LFSGGYGKPNTLRKGLLIPVAILCALAVAGCSSRFGERDVAPHATSAAAPPAPQRNARRIHIARALLSPQSPPDCEYRAPDDTETLDSDVLARLKLDFERHCYQQAEMMVRNRLRQLQVRVTGLHELQPIGHRRRFPR
jgi:hypothetical protein